MSERPVKCSLCNEQMYYLGDSCHEPELQLKSNEEYFHVRCYQERQIADLKRQLAEANERIRLGGYNQTILHRKLELARETQGALTQQLGSAPAEIAGLESQLVELQTELQAAKQEIEWLKGVVQNTAFERNSLNAANLRLRAGIERLIGSLERRRQYYSHREPGPTCQEYAEELKKLLREGE